MKVYVEPSTDEILLKEGDSLIIIQREGSINDDSLQLDFEDDCLIVWIPHGTSADFYLNGMAIETLCSQFKSW